MECKTLVTGDIHGDWKHINNLINKKKPDVVFCCGDFGWWPKEHGRPIETWRSRLNIAKKRKFFDAYGIKPGKAKVYWCDGNHEDHESLTELRKTTETRPIEIMDNIFYMERGSTLTLPNGKTVLFMGGASSTDKDERIAGRDWFPDEIITQKDVYNLPDCEVDILISHTCPEEFHPEIFNSSNKKGVYNSTFSEKFKDPSKIALSAVLNQYKPAQWFFGHFHTYIKKFWAPTNTTWACLNMANESNWWEWLK